MSHTPHHTTARKQRTIATAALAAAAFAAAPAAMASAADAGSPSIGELAGSQAAVAASSSGPATIALAAGLFGMALVNGGLIITGRHNTSEEASVR